MTFSVQNHCLFFQYYENVKPYSLPDQNINIAHLNLANMTRKTNAIVPVGPFLLQHQVDASEGPSHRLSLVKGPQKRALKKGRL